MPVAHIATRECGDVPGWGSRQGPRGCPGAVQIWLRPSLDAALGKSGLRALLRQHSETDLVG